MSIHHHKSSVASRAFKHVRGMISAASGFVSIVAILAVGLSFGSISKTFVSPSMRFTELSQHKLLVVPASGSSEAGYTTPEGAYTTSYTPPQGTYTTSYTPPQSTYTNTYEGGYETVYTNSYSPFQTTYTGGYEQTYTSTYQGFQSSYTPTYTGGYESVYETTYDRCSLGQELVFENGQWKCKDIVCSDGSAPINGQCPAPYCQQSYFYCGTGIDADTLYEHQVYGSAPACDARELAYLHCNNGCDPARGACKRTPDVAGQISAVPLLVAPNRSSLVSWQATSVSRCNIYGGNDTWSCIGVVCAHGAHTTSPLKIKTTYTLNCTVANSPNLVKTVTVDIIPGWVEN